MAVPLLQRDNFVLRRDDVAVRLPPAERKRNGAPAVAKDRRMNRQADLRSPFALQFASECGFTFHYSYISVTACLSTSTDLWLSMVIEYRVTWKNVQQVAAIIN